MRGAPTILHLDMDAFFAAAEQAAKPSLRGKPVVVGGLGPRGVVATASYEARVFGVHSAMVMAQARRLCPNAAYLTPRFSLYRQVSDAVMELLRELSPLVEPLSLDEAFVDLEAGGLPPSADAAREVGERLRAAIRERTSLSGSVGLAGSKMLAKMASEQAKPDGLVLIRPGTERELLAPMPVRALPGVGPATAEHLRRAGIGTLAEMVEAGEAELVRLLGRAHGAALHGLAAGRDDRPVVAERDAKSVSVEDTFDVDLHDRSRVYEEVAGLADRCVRRLRAAGRSGRTVVIKVRRYDFSTLTRSETLRGPTDDPSVVKEAAARLLGQVDTTGGVRLLGVGVTGLADFTQEDLFAHAATEEAVRAATEEAARAAAAESNAIRLGDRRMAESGQETAPQGTGPAAAGPPPVPYGPERGVERDTAPGAAPGAAPGTEAGAEPGAQQARTAPAGSRPGPSSPADGGDGGDTAGPVRRWHPGHDVRHAEYGPGWVQGSGVGRVTVRFETPDSAPGRVHTFAVDDPDLEPSEPVPLVRASPPPGQPSEPAIRPKPSSSTAPSSGGAASMP